MDDLFPVQTGGRKSEKSRALILWFSVVTLTYNRANLVEETVRSVLAQDFTDFEYLIVDDGSTDRTEEVIRRIGDRRLHYIALPHSGKISMLRNFALHKSRGAYLAFVDSDDSWEFNKLAAQVQVMETHPSVGFVFSNGVLIKEQAIRKKLVYSAKHIHSVPASYFKEILANRLSIYPSSVLFRKEAIQRAGGFNESMIAGDMDLITRVASLYPDSCFRRSL
jgi:glycosyltransferase involved in cell wall biosynthesis